MTQHLSIWYLDQLPHELCNLAINDYMQLNTHDAAMGLNSEYKSHSERNTDVGFADYKHWFGQIMRRVGEQSNKECKWDYEITDHECVQFAQYRVGQHYNWHVDNFPLAGHPTERKVTVICLLSDLSEFEAGELQIRLYADYTAPLVKGSIIAFPSILEHRVTPVTAGIRKTATMWLYGPRFK